MTAHPLAEVGFREEHLCHSRGCLRAGHEGEAKTKEPLLFISFPASPNQSRAALQESSLDSPRDPSVLGLPWRGHSREPRGGREWAEEQAWWVPEPRKSKTSNGCTAPFVLHDWWVMQSGGVAPAIRITHSDLHTPVY